MTNITFTPSIETLKALLNDEDSPININIPEEVIYNYLQDNLHDYFDEEALSQAETTITALIDPALDKYVADLRDFGVKARAAEIQQLLKLDVDRAVKNAVHAEINETTARVVAELSGTITDRIAAAVTSQTEMYIQQGVSERLHQIQAGLITPSESVEPLGYVMELSQSA